MGEQEGLSSSHLIGLKEGNAPSQQERYIKSAIETPMGNGKDLEALVDAFQASDFGSALQGTLRAFCAISGAECVAFYRLVNDPPRLTRCAAIGEEIILPDHLPPQELMSLLHTSWWQAGKPPAGTLQHAARRAHCAYLVSAPVGQVGAIIGLVAFAARNPVDRQRAQAMADFAAKTVAGLVQLFSRLESLEEESERLKQQLWRLETLFTHLHEGVVVLDSEGRVASVNEAIRSLLGYSHEVCGQPAARVLIAAEDLSPLLVAAYAGRASEAVDTFHLYRRDGEVLPAGVRVFPLNREGRVEGVLVLIQDHSEREQHLRATQQLEKRALLGEVIAVFAHEVRSPISNISLTLQNMALNLPAEDPLQQSIAAMLQDLERLADQLKSVLSFARPLDYTMEAVDLVRLLQRVLDRWHLRLKRQNVEYAFFAVENCPNVWGYPPALEQVFNNLISNAVQAMVPEGGRLVVKVEPVEQDGQQWVEASVADSGPGIPPELQERIFQPFFTTNKGGTGLGLAIVKRILTAHRGTIRVASVPGGTVFRVQLPLAVEI